MRTLSFVVLALFVSAPGAQESHLSVPLGSLEVLEGRLPGEGEFTFRWGSFGLSVLSPSRVVLDGPAEAYVDYGDVTGDQVFGFSIRPMGIVVRSPEDLELAGTIYLTPDSGRTERVRFRVDLAKAEKVEPERFLAARRIYYDRLLDLRVAGAGWFRHRILESGGEPVQRRPWSIDRGVSDFEDTFALLSGGRAVSENLQLDRAMPGEGGDAATVVVDDIEGITVQEMDWAPYLEGLEVDVDPLARAIPADQYAMLFSSFSDLVALADASDKEGTPILRAYEERSENALTRERYERQLGLRLDGISRLLGPRLIRSVALTGSDPYLRTGSDLALLFETNTAAELVGLLKVQRGLVASGLPGVREVEGELAGVAYDGLVTDDRAVSSYLASTGDMVAVANSLVQLRAVLDARAEVTPALASLPEYTFFRSRYPRGDDEETGLLLIPDLAIRKWCGPRWRIASSRRVRAGAILAEVEAEHVAELVAGPEEGEEISTSWRAVDVGKLTLDPGGVRSSVYNTTRFLTPIAEIELGRVTDREAQVYRLWRDGYQRNWSNFFDPIAVRFEVAEDRIAADVTVMPLIGGTDYGAFIALARGGRIPEEGGDRHESSLARFAIAIDRDSALMQQSGNFLAQMAQGMGATPWAWLGGSLALYLDEDALFEEASTAEDPAAFIQDNLGRLPLALHVDVESPMRLTLFLASVRAFFQQTVPGMTVWETREHNGQPYVRVGSSAQAGAMAPEDLELYYAALPDALVLTLSEELLKRSLDRRAARTAGAERGPDEAALPLLGEHVSVQIRSGFLDMLRAIGMDEEQSRLMRQRSFGNLPILNEWKRLFPRLNPVVVHERVFGTRLQCPGGGTYRWNETWQTMESTIFGHPGEPKEVAVPFPFAGWETGNFGLTFEKDGVRAVCELRRF